MFWEKERNDWFEEDWEDYWTINFFKKSTNNKLTIYEYVKNMSNFIWTAYENDTVSTEEREFILLYVGEYINPQKLDKLIEEPETSERLNNIVNRELFGSEDMFDVMMLKKQLAYIMRNIK